MTRVAALARRLWHRRRWTVVVVSDATNTALPLDPWLTFPTERRARAFAAMLTRLQGFNTRFEVIRRAAGFQLDELRCVVRRVNE